MKIEERNTVLRVADLASRIAQAMEGETVDVSGYSDQEILAANVRAEQLKIMNARRAPTTKASLLDAAKEAVADRGLNYGKPEANFDRIANLWRAHFANCGQDVEIEAADVAQMMVLMKIARLENSPAHLDSWTDIAGYAACGAEITNGENSA